MQDLREQTINLGDNVFYIHMSRGTFHKKQGVVVGFSPKMVKIAITDYRGQTVTINKLPDYVVVK